jgi:hypothetical protein
MNMADSNKVVLKINYQGKNKKLDKSNPPKMVTEWNIKRIILSLALFILFITLILHFISDPAIDLNSDEMFSEKKQPPPLHLTVKPTTEMTSPVSVDNNINQTDEIVSVINSKQSSKLVAENKFNDPINHIAKQEIVANNIQATDTPIEEASVKIERVSKVKSVFKQHKNSRISRGLLTSGIINKEPMDTLGNTLKVSNKEASTVYYFTEIINMKGKILYHHWLRNGQTIFKRKINILGNRWRASTSKLIIYSQLGVWNVRLVDEQGLILNEIQFDVIKSNSNN